MFEWILAARWNGYTWAEFQELPGEEQSLLVAAYRVHSQMDALLAHEQARQARRRAKR